jgi:nucleoside-diphosphate-sugar epimerase
MRIFVAGATGAVGKRLIPLLVASGHTVAGTTRSADKAERLWSAGAEPVVVDALDRDAVVAAVRRTRPDVVVHELTALTGAVSMRRLDRAFEATNRLRTEGTDNLLAAARAAGARRFVAQSFAGWPYARVGGPVKTEEDPLDADPPASARRSLAAIRYLEGAVVGGNGLDGLALRYGGFYGPGTALGPGGMMVEAIRKRRFPIVGRGGGVFSFIHIDDVAGATHAAIERGAPGVYNVADDEPAPVSDWLPVLAAALGAKPPRRLPAWVGRIAAGELLMLMMTQMRGASNAKAKRELDWAPVHPSWRKGFNALA